MRKKIQKKRFPIYHSRIRLLHRNIHLTSNRETMDTRTTDMPLIDATKNTDEPKRKDLETLKRICKNG